MEIKLSDLIGFIELYNRGPRQGKLKRAQT